MALELTLTHQAFDRSNDDYDAWQAGYVAAQQEYPHGVVSHEKANRAAGGSPWSDEVLLFGHTPTKPDMKARKELIHAIVNYGLVENRSGATADPAEINLFNEGAQQGEIDLRDGVRI